MRDLWCLAARSGQKSPVLVADAAAEIAVNRPHGFQIHHGPILPNDRALDVNHATEWRVGNWRYENIVLRGKPGNS
jgi:hypothetical protein